MVCSYHKKTEHQVVFAECGYSYLKDSECDFYLNQRMCARGCNSSVVPEEAPQVSISNADESKYD